MTETVMWAAYKGDGKEDDVESERFDPHLTHLAYDSDHALHRNEE